MTLWYIVTITFSFTVWVMKLINLIVFKENWVWNGISDGSVSNDTLVYSVTSEDRVAATMGDCNCASFMISSVIVDKRCTPPYILPNFYCTPLPLFSPCQCLMALQLVFKSCRVLAFTPPNSFFVLSLSQHCISLYSFCHSTLLGEHN